MHTAEIVVGEVQAERSPVVLPLLTECVREPGEPPNAHSQAQVAALYDGRTNTLWIGSANDWDYLRIDHFGRGVTPFAVARSAVNLDELREVHAVTQGRVNRVPIGPKAIGRDLEIMTRNSLGKTFDESVRSVLISLAYRDIKNQL